MLLLTEWDEYARSLASRRRRLVRRRTLLDARNALDAAAWEAEGWTVRGLGRGRAIGPGEAAGHQLAPRPHRPHRPRLTQPADGTLLRNRLTETLRRNPPTPGP